LLDGKHARKVLPKKLCRARKISFINGARRSRRFSLRIESDSVIIQRLVIADGEAG
jgi:hypothetical protein